MKLSLVSAALAAAIATPAVADQPSDQQRMPPSVVAASQMLSEAANREYLAKAQAEAIRAQLVEVTHERDALKAQVDAMTKVAAAKGAPASAASTPATSAPVPRADPAKTP